ncbi:maleylacetate reductase and hydroxyquinol 1,2-dioxygenase domain-containing protein [Lentzea aerocolonigenes]|uniref:maleylacetate reductase and hydroxyquinol 1,2-dioxygenase domain-containing protein n=1 Tax=Lentzea aerocolonigenes TaxID=68170 RepID=UPI000AB19D49|nr:maleylacetate reductase and hydroxyquinol 1,2-dioxygenase domain-containing protein [Lentzea aerocolonigenes]
MSTARVVFGSGTIGELRDEIERLGGHRILLLGGRGAAAAAARAESLLGELVAARFDGAAQHTPVEVTDEVMRLVRDHGVDCVVAVGGGTVTGLAKALAARAGIEQVIVPTTYAGSEMTPVLGETAGGVKATRSSESIRPGTVIYDVELTLDLPVPLSVTSAMNALAHAVEALYSEDCDDHIAEIALEAVERIGRALPVIVRDPADHTARESLLRAAWLAGTCLGAAGMGLHHKLCHTLGGSFGLPHAETHTVLLPHVIAFTAPATPGVMTAIAKALDAEDAATGVLDLITSASGPTSLSELGLRFDDLEAVAAAAVAVPYPHPRRPSWPELLELLKAAWRGTRPSAARTTDPDLTTLTGQVVASFDTTTDPRRRQLLTSLVRTLHDYVITNDVTEREWQHAVDFLTRTGQTCDDTRQEFILLSDVLGVSSVVDLLANSRTPDTTPSAVLGPFYVEGPPEQDDGADLSGGLPGTPLWIDARVVDSAGNPLGDAVVDVWQSDEDGYYDVQLPDLDGPVLRGRFRTKPDGRFRCWSILPCEYPIPTDGPVGELLAAARRHPYRAPHVHFLIQAAGHRRLITQLFVSGGAYLDLSGGRGDAVFGVKDRLVADFTEHSGPAPDGRVVDGPWRSLEYTFHIAPEDSHDL